MQPAIATIRQWLEEVPDPEIPVISLSELGVIRDVAWEGDCLVIVVTPTYSGCPATAIINLDIVSAMNRRGLNNVVVRTQISPAWTTDWISESGKQKLRAYGIAPPNGPAGICAGILKAGPVPCPQCGSSKTEMISAFGSTPCKAHYQCTHCREPFDYFKAI